MSFMQSLIGKCTRKLTTAFTLVPLFLRYSSSVLFVHKPPSHRIHGFSQLLVFSPRLRRLQGMTSLTERAYFQWYARQIYTGFGDIVDLGCWLGSTTIPIAMGLVRNPNPKASLGKIHAYDDFVWKSYMDDGLAGTLLEGRYHAGESFLEEFNKLITPWKDRIKVHPGDLGQISWDGGKIEFLLIDAMKSWELANNIIRYFFPALIPGRSFILHQDFAHWYTPWIHLINYRLRDYFQPVYDIPMSGSMVFRLCKPIPFGLLTNIDSFSSFTMDEVHAAFDYSQSLVGRDKRPNIAAAKVMLYIHLGDLGQATRELEKYRSEGMTFSSDLAIVEERLFNAQLTIR